MSASQVVGSWTGYVRTVATTAGYGRWASPLAARDVARAKVSLSELCSDGEALYWLESRPAEAGRVVIVRSSAEGQSDHSPAGVSVRSRVHEYGGGAMCLVPARSTGAFAYVDQADQRVWFCDGPGSQARPQPLSATPPEGDVHHHGGLSATPDGDWVVAVREVHVSGTRRPVRSIVALSTRGAPPDETTLLEGHDFFGSPRVHPDGDRLAVVVWDHPDMPWDASAVVVVPLARVTRATPGPATLEADGAAWLVAGGPGESVGQPAWARDGSLRFVSDRRGWWQPYAHPGRPDSAEATALSDVAAEFHGPDWVLGQTTMAEVVDGTVVARMTASGRDALVLLVPGRATAAPPRLPQPCVSISALCAHADGLAFIGSTPDAPANVWIWAPDGVILPLRPPPDVVLGRGDVALGEPFTLTGRSGRPVYGTLYRPTQRG